MHVPVVVDGKPFHFNVELNVDAHSGAFVGVSVRDEEDAAAVVDALHDNIHLSSRNLHGVMVLETREVDPVSLVRFYHVMLTRAAVTHFVEILA